MAKRFTDTEKWKDEWWGSLSNDYRMIWLYLVDSCSIAGIWKKDFRGLNFNCNTKISEKEFIEVFGSRLIDRGNFFFIPKFLRFQCPKGLNSNKPAILSIVKEIEQNNLTLIIHQSFGNDFLIIKGKDKGTGKEEGKGTGQGMGEPEIVKTLEWFVSQIDEIYLENLKYHHTVLVEDTFYICNVVLQDFSDLNRYVIIKVSGFEPLVSNVTNTLKDINRLNVELNNIKDYIK